VDRPGSSRPAVAWAPGWILSPSPPSSSTQGTHRASSGGALDTGPREGDTGVSTAGRASHGLAGAAGTVVTERLQAGVPTTFLPRLRLLAGVSGRRSLSSSTPSGEGRLVRDGGGRFVRSTTGGDRGDDEMGKKRVRDNNNTDGAAAAVAGGEEGGAVAGEAGASAGAAAVVAPGSSTRR
jgi:hypothetical protein